MRDRAVRGRRGYLGNADVRPRARPGGGAQVRRREPSRSAPLETVYPRIPGTDSPDRSARAGAGPPDQRAPTCASAGAGRTSPQGARRASGKLHERDEVARSDPAFRDLREGGFPGAGSVSNFQRRVVQPHGGDRAGGVGRLAAGCGIRTAEVGPVSRTAGSVRRIRTAEVGAGQRRDMWIRVQRAPHVGNDEAVISNPKAPTALSIGVRATRGGARR